MTKNQISDDTKYMYMSKFGCEMDSRYDFHANPNYMDNTRGIFIGGVKLFGAVGRTPFCDVEFWSALTHEALNDPGW